MAAAASRRMSAFLWSANAQATCTIAFMAKSCAMTPDTIFATAWCLPTGWPHCWRVEVHHFASSTSAMPPPIAAAGMPRRPTLSVASAILRPSPGLPIMFSTGTFTSLKVTTPFASARRPMKRERRAISTPGHDVSTMKHVICGMDLPVGSTLSGVRASTAISVVLGSVTLVHHSLSPSRM